MARSFLRFQLNSFLLMLCAVLLTAAVGLARGDVTAAFFIRALDWSAFACILLGCISVLGAFASRGGFEVQFSRSAGPEGLDRRSSTDARDMLGSFYHLVLFGWTAGLLILLSMLIHHIAS